MENGNEPAFATSDGGTEFNTTWQGQKGLTKREYFASKYVDVSNDFVKETTAGEIKSFLGLDGAVTYDPFVHYPQAVVKLQLMFADELLKQLDHEGE